MEISNGFVYIMSNTHYAGILKIGLSKKDPVIRADQLSKNTGALGIFMVEWSKEVPSMDIAERILHFTFRRFYFQKEFYEIDLETAIRIATSTLDNFFENDSKTQFPLEMKKKSKELKLNLTNKELIEFEIEALNLEKELKKL